MSRGTIAVPLLASLVLAAAPALAGGELTARIDVKGRYYRAGEPVEVRITLENIGDESVPNPEGIPLLGSLELEAGDKALRAAAVPELDAATQPGIFVAGGSYQQIVDLTPHFPVLAEPGTYVLRFTREGMEPATVSLFLAPPYDPGLDYQATLKTDHGEVTFDLLEDVAPDHVRNFVDLARRGFYDDTLFSIIARGEIIVGGGEPEGSNEITYFLNPEISGLPHERGTLSSVRTMGNDNGSQFFIDLRREPDRDGNFSIFGRMISGDETLTALEGVATTGKNYQPFYKPLKETYLRKVVILERPRDAEASDAGNEDSSPGS